MAAASNGTRIRLIVIFMFICVFCLLLTFRLGWIQIVSGEELAIMAAHQQTRDVPIEARRGTIYDRNGNVLAMSAASFTIWVRPDEVRRVRGGNEELSRQQVNNTAETLATILDMDQERVHEIITQNRALIRVASNVKREEANEIRQARLRGIEITEGVSRHYPLGAFAAHILGGVTDDNNGLFGIELRYDRYLSGVPGRWIKNTDMRGANLGRGVERYFGADDGLNIVLTIDEVIQHYVERALENVWETTSADRVTSIVMDPRTGDILAMASLPHFDPNNPRVPLCPYEAALVAEMSSGDQIAHWNSMWRNPAFSDVFEPGSTFKIITNAMALEENVTHLRDTSFVCRGTINVSGSTIRCWRHFNPHGQQNLIETFGNSCNPAFVALAQRLGLTRFYKYLELFGLTERTGIDFPGEASPLVQNRSTAGPVGLATMSFGQGIAITPLQLLSASAVVGNDGKLMQPRLVKALTDSEGNIVQEFEPRVVRQVISENTAAEMKLILEYSVSQLGGGNAAVPGFRVGGKTGTAQRARYGVYIRGEVVGSFIGMAPMDDPQIAVLMVVENPRSAQFGSLTAAPGVRLILEDVLRYLNVQPRFTQEELDRMQRNKTTVPDVVGQSFSEAAGMIGGAELEYTVAPARSLYEDFLITGQFPQAGTSISTGGMVFLYWE